jgi:peptidoglycan/LPS O-acetylase OafA/YrhL
MTMQKPVQSVIWRPAARFAAFGFGAVAAFFLFTEHRAHLFGWLPYLFLLACPVMMLFMHHGHDTHDHHDPTPDKPELPNTQGKISP